MRKKFLTQQGLFYSGGLQVLKAQLLPKIKLELVLDDKLVEPVIDAIIKNASTGKIGDGKIFLYKVEEAIRIRNQDRGAAAL